MKEIKPAILLFVIFTVICGGIYPAVVTGMAHAVFPQAGQGELHHRQKRQGDRFQPDRPALLRPEILLAPALGHRRFRLQPAGFRRLQCRPDQSRLTCKTVGDRVKALRDTRRHRQRSRPNWCRPRPAASTRISLPRRPCCRCRGSPRPRNLPEDEC